EAFVDDACIIRIADFGAWFAPFPTIRVGVCEAVRCSGISGPEGLPAHPASLLRHAPYGPRRRRQGRAGGSRARKVVDDTGVHVGYTTEVERRLRVRAPARPQARRKGVGGVGATDGPGNYR